VSKKTKDNSIAPLDLNKKLIQNKRQAMSKLKRIMKDSFLEFRNLNQKKMYSTMSSKEITFVGGPAGVGKTYIVSHYALKSLIEKGTPYDGIVITKPLVEANGEKIGFLPGDLSEKTDPFMMSYWYNIRKFIGSDTMDILIHEKVIEVIPLAFMRGLTLDNKIVILDEAQNATPEQIKMFLTRIGDRSKYIICGDVEQTDRKDANGLADSLTRFTNMNEIGICTFNKEDIVRNNLISKILDRYQDDV